MGLYSEKLLDYVRNINAPIKTTSTTTLNQPNEGLDIGSLLMMLMMGGMFKKPTAGIGANQSALNLLSQQNLPAPAGTMGGGTEGILQLLSSLGPLLGK
jgi:hypothetical protein